MDTHDPGYGQSDMPDRSKFAYTFDRFAKLVDGLYRFTHFGVFLNPDVQAADTALKTRCSKEKEGP